jgi:hypothetical protein
MDGRGMLAESVICWGILLYGDWKGDKALGVNLWAICIEEMTGKLLRGR